MKAIIAGRYIMVYFLIFGKLSANVFMCVFCQFLLAVSVLTNSKRTFYKNSAQDIIYFSICH